MVNTACDPISAVPTPSGSLEYTSRQLPDCAFRHHEASKGLGFQIWPAALLMCQYLEHKDVASPGCWKGLHVLELGSGCGLTGLVAASLGAHLLMTDLPGPVELLKANIETNKTNLLHNGGSCRTCCFRWEQCHASLPEAWHVADVVLASDCIYHADLMQPFLASLLATVSRSAVAYVSHVRRWKTDKVFFKRARKHFVVEDITGHVDAQADMLASNTTGVARLFCLKHQAR